MYTLSSILPTHLPTGDAFSLGLRSKCSQDKLPQTFSGGSIMITIVPADTIYYHVFQMCWRRSAVQNWVLPREVSWPVWGERSVLSSSRHVRRGRGGGGGGDIGGGAHPQDSVAAALQLHPHQADDGLHQAGGER